MRKKCDTVVIRGSVGFKVNVENLTKEDFNEYLEKNKRNASYRYKL